MKLIVRVLFEKNEKYTQNIEIETGANIDSIRTSILNTLLIPKNKQVLRFKHDGFTVIM